MSDEFPDLDRWEDGQADDLNVAEDFPQDSVVAAKADAAHRKANQTHRFRERFFWAISGSLIGALVASVVVMGLYIWSQWGDVSASAVISFNAAVVVNVLGLALILANYLFPKGGGE